MLRVEEKHLRPFFKVCLQQKTLKFRTPFGFHVATMPSGWRSCESLPVRTTAVDGHVSFVR